MSRDRGLVFCLLGILVIATLTALAYRLPSPRAASADANDFSAHRARMQLERLVGDGSPHPLGSEANERVRSSIVQRLSALGFRTEIQSGFICNPFAVCGTPSNIIALPAQRDSAATDAAAGDDLVLLAAHYDSVPAGPGASDDAAGVAAVLEIARILAAAPPTRHPVAILISDGEEAGLLGALLFVHQHPMAKQVLAAVNLEARGTSGPSLMFETGSANSWLMSLYRTAVARPITDSLYYDAYKTLPNSTDFSVFKSAGWQGFNFAYIGDVAHYHTALDTVANADLRSIQHQGENALASLVALADSPTLRAHPPADAVYFDVLSRALLVWPARSSTLFAGAALFLLLIEAALLCRKHLVRAAHIAWGALGACMCVLLGGAASSLAVVLLLKTGKLPPMGRYSWVAHPAWMNFTCVALAAAAAGLSAQWFARRAGFWGLWLGAALLLGASAAVLAAFRPGMSFALLITVGVATLAAMPSVIATRPRRVVHLAALAPVWVMSALLIPLVSLLYGALGGIAWVIDTLLLSLGATLLMPALAAASDALRRRLIGVALIASIIGVVLTMALPTYSAAWPQRLNFRYRLDAHAHRADWLAEADSLQLPDFVAGAAAFESNPVLEYPDGRGRAFAAPAASIDLPPPTMQVREAAVERPDATRYQIHLQSQRGAPKIAVVFPAGAQVREIIVNESSGERRVPLAEGSNGTTRLRIVGLSKQGMDFAFEARGASVEVHLYDESYTLSGGEFLQRLRPSEASSSQDGDTTIVENLVVLRPAAGP